MNVNSISRATLRTLSLFETFAETGAPATLSELARLMHIPVSTCHGLVKTLQGSGYMYSVGPSRRLYPTKRLLDIAESIANQDPVVEYVSEHLAALRDATGETVILGMRQGDEIVYIEVIEGINVIRYSAKPGDLKPLHSSAIGKTILGQIDKAELADSLGKLKLNRVTDNTITDNEMLVEDLARSRGRGYYITHGENVAEVMAIAAPVLLAGEVFGIAVAGPLERMSRAFEHNRDALFSHCRQIRSDFAQ